ncbi:hypothetical protein DSO57_1000928 [Entomophthora muscae]|uniref:Uncharacterized protein n=1 Tax=Entomophthora muscae TaxID=34485 RepID=A0ACC2TL59_9FUNG|nr:hypothetical protein DSO57_1000928 [Entomophthora muscae]
MYTMMFVLHFDTPYFLIAPYGHLERYKSLERKIFAAHEVGPLTLCQPAGPSVPYHERPGYSGFHMCKYKGHMVRNCTSLKASKKVQEYLQISHSPPRCSQGVLTVNQDKDDLLTEDYTSKNLEHSKRIGDGHRETPSPD